MTLDGKKLADILYGINAGKEVSMYYKRYLLREGYIIREKKPISGPGRPGYLYVVSEKGLEAMNVGS